MLVLPKRERRSFRSIIPLSAPSFFTEDKPYAAKSMASMLRCSERRNSAWVPSDPRRHLKFGMWVRFVENAKIADK